MNTVNTTIAAQLRDKVGLGKSYASQLASGQRTPSLDLAVRIEKATGIKPSFWIDRNSPTSPPDKTDEATALATYPQDESVKRVRVRKPRQAGEVAA